MLLQSISLVAVEGSSLVVNSIEMSDSQGLLKALNREQSTATQLNRYIFVAQKKYDSLASKLQLWRRAQILARLGIPIGTIIALIAGGGIGGYRALKWSEQNVDNLAHVGVAAFLGGSGGAIAGAGGGLIASISALAFVQKQVSAYENKVEKAQINLLILQDALNRLNAS